MGGSSHSGVFCYKSVLKMIVKSSKNISEGVPSNKVAGLQPATINENQLLQNYSYKILLNL